ncbi:lipase family protein [Paenibacillus tepidiphilus]|uniref:lipase family protein n=1 Tax=Paenibacillus tepidiphilus TaxID=2608683 RepID=UPI00123A6A6C|nr:lipase family protein [Paenibacillus tepidiphilus]
MGKADNGNRWAIFLAAVCAQTYAQYSNADGAFVIPRGYTQTATIEAVSIAGVKERFGFILESEEAIIVAFRGTSSATDWFSDMIASQKRFKYIKEDVLTHRGFTDIYSSARPGILSALRELPAGKSLYVTGHSLGAALATLCAADVAANTGHLPPLLYTYGSPRVGDPDFAKAAGSYAAAIFRYANPFDIVVHAPPTVYKLPKREKKYYYSHVRPLYSLPFQNGAIGLNHIISSYFAELSKSDPQFTKELRLANPGFCPVPAVRVMV